MTAHEELTRALLDLAGQGKRTPCQHPGVRDRWTSDSRDERAYAAAACRMCPVLAQCLTAADETRAAWHVWGGIDWTTTPRRTTRRTTATPALNLNREASA